MTKNINTALLNAKKILASTKFDKTGRNKFQGYNFIESDEINKRVLAALNKAGIIYAPSIDEVIENERYETILKDKVKVQYRWVIRIVHNYHHSESGESIAMESIGESLDSGDKGFNKAFTAGSKYHFVRFFQISEGIADPDSLDPNAPGQNAPTLDRETLTKKIRSAFKRAGDTITKEREEKLKTLPISDLNDILKAYS